MDPKNIDDLIKKTNQMKDKMKQAQADLAKLEVTGESGGGLIKVRMNGRHDIPSGGVFIDDSLVKGNKKVLEDLVGAAVNDAVRKIEAKGQEMVAKMTAGLDMPDFKMPSPTNPNTITKP